MSEGPSVEKATFFSWCVNWFLLFAKLFVAIFSGSKAMYAALAGNNPTAFNIIC